MDEETSIARAREGDEQAACKLVSCHKDRIFTVLMRQTGDAAVAEDLAQETFLRAFRGLRTYRGHAAFSTWLIRIALNVAHSYYGSRAYRQSRRTTPFELGEHDRSAGGCDADADVELGHYRAALGDLKPKYREVIVLCGFEQLPYEEAARVLGVPIGTVRSRLHQARALMKRAVERRLSHADQ